MIAHVPQMISAGITSLKIEGRMKGIHYLATTVKTYRAAIDAYLDAPGDYAPRPEWLESLGRIGNRGYCTGFYLGDPDQTLPNYAGSRMEDQHFIAKVIRQIDRHYTCVNVRNKFHTDDPVEIISAAGPDRRDCIQEIRDRNDRPVPFARPGSIVTIKLQNAGSPNDLIRKIA